MASYDFTPGVPYIVCSLVVPAVAERVKPFLIVTCCTGDGEIITKTELPSADVTRVYLRKTLEKMDHPDATVDARSKAYFEEGMRDHYRRVLALAAILWPDEDMEDFVTTPTPQEE